ncbi:MAG: dockerin type I repeat-containing protein [Dehalococcoidia bacterium]
MKGIVSQSTGRLAAISIVAALVWAVLAVSSAFAAGPGVSIGSAELGPDSEGKVELEGLDFGEPGLGAWTVDVHYNPEIVTLVDCDAEHGGLCNKSFGDGVARVTGVSATGLKGDFTLGVLTFACKNVGASDLGLSLDVLADATLGDPQPIDGKLSHGEVVCAEDHEKKLGDADCNGELTAIDAILILQYGAEMIDTLPCLDLADANGDGQVNSVDAAIVLQTVAGLI